MLIFEAQGKTIRWVSFEQDNTQTTGTFLLEPSAAEKALENLFPRLLQENLVYILPNGGQMITTPVMPLKPPDITRISELSHYRPEENASILHWLERCLNAAPTARHILLCETAIFCHLPSVAGLYPLPYDLSQRYAIRRYGGDGLCYQSALDALAKHLGGIPTRLISIHLSEFTGIVAQQAGIPVDTTMGFSPYEGIASLHSIGNLDASVTLDMMNHGFTLQQIEDILTHQSGLSAIAEQDISMEDLYLSQTGRPRFARDFLQREILKGIGAAMAVLEGADGILWIASQSAVSSGFIGEIIAQLGFLPIKKSHTAQTTGSLTCLTDSESKIACYHWVYHRWKELRAQVENYLALSQ